MRSEETKPSGIEFHNRLEQLIRNLHPSQKEFAENIDVSESQLSEILKGKRFPGYKFFEKLALHTPVNLNWLITGQGNMLNENQNQAIAREFGDQGENIGQLLELCKISPLVKLQLQAWTHNFLLQNEELIKKDIEKQNNRPI